MRKISVLFFAGILALLSTGCMSTNQTITGDLPEIKIEPKNIDLELTEPMEASAVTIRVFGIDWERLFGSRTATVKASVYAPNILGFDRTDQYALFNLLKQNPGYDMVLYPQITTITRKPFLGLGLIYMETEVKVSARLGKLRI